MTDEEKKQLEIILYDLSGAILLDRKGWAYNCIGDIRILAGLEKYPESLSSTDALYIICNKWGISMDEIAIPKKKKYVQPRYVYMYILYYCFNKGVEVIAEELNCDHTSVSYGKKVVLDWAEYDKEFRNKFDPTLEKFRNGKKVGVDSIENSNKPTG